MTATDEHVEYERTVGSGAETLVRLSARCVSRSHPPGSGTHSWRLRLEQFARADLATGTTTRVGSRSEAIRALFGAMRAVDSAVRSGGTGDDSAACLTGFAGRVEGW